MSSVIISGDTSGAITLSAPAVAGTNTITLPATTGTVVLTGTTPTLNGITFPATQVPSADANTLDDYEEGTWTPTVGGTATYNAQIGNYTRIGNVVNIRGVLNINTIGTGSTNSFSGLPFYPPSTGWHYLGIGYNTSLAVNVVEIHLIVQDASSGNVLTFGRTAASTGATAQSIFGNNAYIIFSGSYQLI